MNRHKVADFKDQQRMNNDWQSEAKISESYSKQRHQFLQMLTQFLLVLDRLLGRITISKHKIEFLANPNSDHSAPYQAGPTVPDLQRNTIKKMLSQDVIDSSRIERVALIVFAPKEGAPLPFCVDYRKLNNLTHHNSYSISLLDECINSLWELTVVSTSDCSSGHLSVKIREEDRYKTSFTAHRGPICFFTIAVWFEKHPGNVSTKYRCHPRERRMAVRSRIPRRQNDFLNDGRETHQTCSTIFHAPPSRR